MYLTNYNITIFSGSPTEFLEHYIFPILLPALEDMLRAAKLEKCFEVCQKNVFSLSPKLNSLLFMFLEKPHEVQCLRFLNRVPLQVEQLRVA